MHITSEGHFVDMLKGMTWSSRYILCSLSAENGQGHMKLPSQMSDGATLFIPKRCSIRAQDIRSCDCSLMPRQAVEDLAMRNSSMRALAHPSYNDFAMLSLAFPRDHLAS